MNRDDQEVGDQGVLICIQPTRPEDLVLNRGSLISHAFGRNMAGTAISKGPSRGSTRQLKSQSHVYHHETSRFCGSDGDLVWKERLKCLEIV